MTKISVLVLNFNAEDYISPCLDSLITLAHPGAELEIIVINNASADNSLKLVKTKYPKLTVLENNHNLGYAEGNNVGIRYALNKKCDFIWIVNPDMTVAKNALSELLKAAEIYPRVGVFGSKIYFAKGYEFHKSRYKRGDLGKVIWFAGGIVDWKNIQGIHPGVDTVDTGQFAMDSQTEFVTGASMFVRAEVFAGVGLLDSRYFLYYEENDFCQRVTRAGWKLMFIAKSIAWHRNAQATGIGSSLQDYYITRNRMLFGMRYASLKMKYFLVKESLRLFFTGRPWQRTGVKDYYLGNFGVGSYR